VETVQSLPSNTITLSKHPDDDERSMLDFSAMSESSSNRRMTPQDVLLSNHDSKRVWCLAEPGRQYLVFATESDSFTVSLSAGQYDRNQWVDTKTGDVQAVDSFTVTGEENKSFSPPNDDTDWVLLLR
jgi:hypothetical protein